MIDVHQGGRFNLEKARNELTRGVLYLDLRTDGCQARRGIVIADFQRGAKRGPRHNGALVKAQPDTGTDAVAPCTTCSYKADGDQHEAPADGSHITVPHIRWRSVSHDLFA